MRTKANDVLVVKKADWTNDYLHRNLPVLIEDGLEQWPAMATWSPESLRRRSGGTKVDVLVSDSGLYRWSEDATPVDQRVVKDLDLSEAADCIMQPAPDGQTHYLFVSDVKRKFPDLCADLRFPDVPAEQYVVNVWFGSAGTISQLHFDGSNNFYAQLHGTKEFTLFAPEDGPYLYPLREGCRMPHMSQIDLRQPDVTAFPLYMNARPLSVTVREGQLLFLPAFWWHFVRSTSIAVSANQWWPPHLSQCASATATRLLRSEFKRDRWTGIRRDFGLDGLRLLYAAQALLAGNGAVASLALAASADNLDATQTAAALEHDGLSAAWQRLMSAVTQGVEHPEETVSGAELDGMVQALMNVGALAAANTGSVASH